MCGPTRAASASRLPSGCARLLLLHHSKKPPITLNNGAIAHQKQQQVRGGPSSKLLTLSSCRCNAAGNTSTKAPKLGASLLPQVLSRAFRHYVKHASTAAPMFIPIVYLFSGTGYLRTIILVLATRIFLSKLLRAPAEHGIS